MYWSFVVLNASPELLRELSVHVPGVGQASSNNKTTALDFNNCLVDVLDLVDNTTNVSTVGMLSQGVGMLGRYAQTP